MAPRGSRVRRGLLAAAKALGLASVALAALPLGLLLHMDLGPFRRLATNLASNGLSDYFRGEVRLGDVESLDARGFELSEALVFDTAGRRVLKLSNLRLRANSLDFLRKLLGSDEKISLVIAHIRVEAADVRIFPDAEGIPTLGDALTPRVSDDAPSQRSVRVWLPTIEVGEIFARGSVLGTPTLEARLRKTRGSVLTTPKGVAVDVERFGLKLSGLGGTDARGLASLHVRAPGPVWGYFDGYMGDTQVSASVEVEGDRIAAVVDAPQATPEGVRALWPGYPLEETLAAHAEVSGTLPRLETTIEAQIGTGSLHASGPLIVGEQITLEMAVRGSDLDVASVVPTLPHSRISVAATLGLLRSDSELLLELRGATERAAWGSWDLPAVDFVGTYNSQGFEARLTPHEPGFPITAAILVPPSGGVEVALQSPGVPLQHPRLKPYWDATGSATLDAAARIKDNDLHVSLTSKLRDLETAGARLARGTLKGTIDGNIEQLDALRLNFELRAEEGRFDELSFDTVSATIKGPVNRPQLSAQLAQPGDGKISVSGAILTGNERGVSDLSATLERDGASVQVSAQRASVDDQGLTLRGVALRDGQGELRLDAEVTGGQFRVKAAGDRLDLNTVSRALGLKRGALEGQLLIDADLASTPTGPSGRLVLSVRDARLPGLPPLEGRAKANFDKGHVVAEGSLSVEGLGTIDASIDADLQGPVAEVATWRNALGKLDVFAYQIDLSYLDRYLSPDSQVKALRGRGEARLSLERRRPQAFSRAQVDAQTQGLQVELKSPVANDPLATIAGLDLQLGASIDGNSGRSEASLRLVDLGGALVSGTLTTLVDPERLLAEPAHALAEVLKQDSEALIVTSDRDLTSLPAQIRPDGLEGTVSARVKLSGPLNSPKVSATLTARQLRGAATQLTRPLDLSARLGYLHETGRANLNLEGVQGQRKLFWGTFSGRLDLQKLAALPDNAAAEDVFETLSGGGTLLVEALPLKLVQSAFRSPIDGTLQGIAAVSLEGRVPELNVQLKVLEPVIAGVRVGEGQLSLRAGEETTVAQARFVTETGELSLEAASQVDAITLLSDGLVDQPLELQLLSRKFDAVLLLPFVEELFTDISGELDADVRLALWPSRPQTDTSIGEPVWNADIVGKAHLSQALLDPKEVGLRLTDADLQVETKREGAYNVVDIISLSAHARADYENLNAKARLYFRGMELSHGWATVGADRVPFMTSGVRWADVSGQARGTFTMHPDRIEATLELPTISAELPRSSERNLIDLDGNDDIFVYQPLGPAKANTGPSLPWHLKLKLGDDVSVRSSTLNLKLMGEPLLVLGEELDAQGRILLTPGGRVQVAGKLFVITSGFVAFDTGEFTNPLINISADWRAPNGVRVTALLQGTARAPSLRLESDPALPGGETEIYALLFGGGTASPTGSSASPALGMGAAFLSDVLGGTELRDIQLRASEERTGGGGQSSLFAEGSVQSYVAGVQISDELWFEASYKSQTSSAGEDQSGVSGTLDWRFRPDWSLRTEAGSLGTGLDLLWQYRY